MKHKSQILTLLVVGILSFTSIFSLFGRKKSNAPESPQKKETENTAVHITSFVMNHTGMYCEPYYMLQRKGNGIYFKYSDKSPISYSMAENGEMLSEKDYFRYIDTVKSVENAKSFFITDANILEELDKALNEAGAVKWHGSVSQPSQPGLTDTGDSYRCYFQTTDGKEVNCHYYNVKPNGWDKVRDVLYSTFAKIEKMDAEKKASPTSAIDDKNLTMMVDYFWKVVGTVGGDKHTESVLYKDDATGVYTIHTYSQTEGSDEKHRAFRTTEQQALAIIKEVENANLEQYKREMHGCPITGGYYVLKYKNGNKMERITNENVPCEKIDIFNTINHMMQTSMGEEILP